MQRYVGSCLLALLLAVSVLAGLTGVASNHMSRTANDLA
jgi:hypothetical protein